MLQCAPFLGVPHVGHVFPFRIVGLAVAAAGLALGCGWRCCVCCGRTTTTGRCCGGGERGGGGGGGGREKGKKEKEEATNQPTNEARSVLLIRLTVLAASIWFAPPDAPKVHTKGPRHVWRRRREQGHGPHPAARNTWLLVTGYRTIGKGRDS